MVSLNKPQIAFKFSHAYSVVTEESGGKDPPSHPRQLMEINIHRHATADFPVAQNPTTH
jgi:hypothetical protein